MNDELDIVTFNDFNSLEIRINYTTERLINMGISIPTYTGRTWTYDDFLVYTYLNNIENGIENLGTYYFKPTGWLEKKTWAEKMSFSYSDINRWINNLNLLNERLDRREEYLYPSNNLFPSNEVFPK